MLWENGSAISPQAECCCIFHIISSLEGFLALLRILGAADVLNGNIGLFD